MRKLIKVDEAYQKKYTYTLTESPGQNFDPDFKPELTPAQMLALGVFGGDYYNSPPQEFPETWFKYAKINPTGGAKDALNYFEVNASQPLSVWQKNDWIYPEDPKGWFLWYCRYFLGRRIPDEDQRQIKRWRAMRRHIAQLQKNCAPRNHDCHRKQRQALLHWAYDSRKI